MIRRNDDGGTNHQNPLEGEVNYLHAELSNFGPGVDPPREAMGQLEVYVVKASMGLTSPGDWELAGTVPDLDLDPDETRTVNIPWTPDDTGHFCIIAIWVSNGDPLTQALGQSVTSNTRFNNNVAWRNVNVLTVGDLDFAVTVEVLWLAKYTVIPEPSTALLLTAGLAGLAMRRRHSN